MNRPKDHSLLIVDDEPRTLNSLQGLLRREYNVFLASSGEEALGILEREPIHVVLSDQRMDGLSGADFLCRVRDRFPRTIRMLMTGYSDVEAIMKAVNQGQIYGYISKPWKVEDLLLMIGQAIRHWEALEANERLTGELRRANEGLEQKVAERTRELRNLETFNSNLISSLQSGLMVVSPEIRVETINPAGAQILGATVPSLEDVALPEHPAVAAFAPAVEKTIASGRGLEFQEMVLERDGHEHVIGFGTSVLTTPEDSRRGVIIIFRDVTEKKHLEEQLIQSEKLASIGELAGGVAHEINNPLGVILGFAQLLLRSNPDDEKVVKKLKHIETQALRCKNIVQTLLKFSRKSPTSSTQVNVTQVIQDALDLLSRQLEVENVQVHKEIEDDRLIIRANENEVQQVLFNLIVNAKDAMTEGGTLSIRAARRAGHVRIEVQDTGGGIDPKIRDKIFNTFFTTKPVGKGTGLGLPITRSLVTKHGGMLTFDSVTGVGTTFLVEFPEGRRDQGVVEASAPGVESVGLTGLRILVVDDEEDILNLCRDLLKDHNTVDLAGNGGIAMKMLRETRYDLLLCDIMMPQVDGVRLLQMLRDEIPVRRPPIVVMTGRPPREILKQKESLGIIEIVTKPFTLTELQGVLRKAWDWYQSNRSSGAAP